MLSPEIPRSVTIIVKSGENLEYSVPGSKITPKSRKWCVVFIGGKRKMITDLVEAQNGCPVWDSEVSIDLVSPTEPVVMRVLDGDKHHIGQVVIPLVRIPRTGPPNFDPSRLQYSELEPTKKNSAPRGRLTYWIWATGYWPPGTKYESKPKSIRGSLSHLKRSKSKSSRAPSMVSGAYSESNLSGETGYLGGGGGGGGAMLWSGTQPNYGAHLDVPRASYNPLAGCDDNASSTGTQQVTGLPPVYHPSMYQTHGSPESLSGSVADIHSKKHKGIFKKMKHSLSQSTQNLRSVAKKAGGDKIYRDSGSVISVSSSKHRLTLPDSTSTIIGQYPNGSITSLQPRDDLTTRTSVLENTALGQQTAVLGNIPLKTDAPKLSKEFPQSHPGDSPLSAHESNAWGMHPEEREKKPLEEMSHRELVNYAMQLERSAQVTRAELARVQTECEELAQKSASTEQDLDSVRLALADLRVRLLTAGLTEFLERSTENDGPVSGVGLDERKRAMSLGGGPQSFAPVDTSQSFLNRLAALTVNTRKFGGSADPPMPVGPTSTSTDWW